MAGKGRKVIFFGSFRSKAAAVAKEKEHKKSFIIERSVDGLTRYFVVKEKN